MRNTAIPLEARQDAIKLALMEGRLEDAQRLRADLYVELLEYIGSYAHAYEENVWARSVEQFLKTEALFQ